MSSALLHALFLFFFPYVLFLVFMNVVSCFLSDDINKADIWHCCCFLLLSAWSLYPLGSFLLSALVSAFHAWHSPQMTEDHWFTFVSESKILKTWSDDLNEQTGVLYSRMIRQELGYFENSFFPSIWSVLTERNPPVFRFGSVRLASSALRTMGRKEGGGPHLSKRRHFNWIPFRICKILYTHTHTHTW